MGVSVSVPRDMLMMEAQKSNAMTPKTCVRGSQNLVSVTPPHSSTNWRRNSREKWPSNCKQRESGHLTVNREKVANSNCNRGESRPSNCKQREVGYLTVNERSGHLTVNREKVAI
ncbi:hypothetical protein BaRGS_00030195 [Batillaria attramentaria]|uniref:Uncharacterized protein n=1 Tax=Batillaria attramentaria TaxID=370345 RepID=A0ABD0JUJ1_9CAEN